MNWVFIQHRFSGSLPSCARARGQELALRPDALAQLGELSPANVIAAKAPMAVKQRHFGAETEQINRTDTRCASAAHF